MTELEWGICRDAHRMLDLFTRRHTHTGEYSNLQTPSKRKLQLLNEAWQSSLCGSERLAISTVSNDTPWGRCHATLACITKPFLSVAAHLTRDIFGNPFRPVTVSQAWLTPQVLTLAEAAYRERTAETCGKCRGRGYVLEQHIPSLVKALRDKPEQPTRLPPPERRECDSCGGWGTLETGGLDPVRLAILSDGLEEAGCPVDVETDCVCVQYKDDLDNPWGKVGYRPERDPASGRHEGGWSNCKICNSGRGRAGVVIKPNPVLEHLRNGGVHVRGCHVLDVILGKS